MKLVARRVDVPPDPLSIARRLADEPGFAFLWNALGEGPSTIACRPILRSSELDPEPSLVREPAPNLLGAVPRWIGLLPYECRRDLERSAWTRSPDDRAEPLVSRPLWCRYGAVVHVHRDVLVVGDDGAAVRDLAARLERPSSSRPVRVDRLSASEPDAAHEARIRRALQLIEQGELYQVNLARRFDFRVEGRAVDLVARFVERSRVPFAAAFELDGLRIAASSPESFLELDAFGRASTRPIKGTRPRGRDAAEDARLVEELEHDPKERAELSMVIDVERNDLGRVAKVGSVRVVGAPRVETYGTVHHRVASVVATVPAEVTRRAVLEAMLPSGSVTGAPKVRAMEVIAALESARRGLYTGAFGSLSHDGSLSLGMAIRVLVAQGETGHYFAGGGIVHGSEPGREVLETTWKAAQVERRFSTPV